MTSIRSWISLLVTTAFLCAASLAQVTTRATVASDGTGANGGTFFFCISADGRFVAYDSDASNLVAGDTNAAFDVFVHDLTNGITERLSISSSGVQANARCQGPSVSANGRYVVFGGLASNLVLGDGNGSSDVFVRDRQSGTTELVSVDSLGVQGNSDSSVASISANGRYVAFTSDANNLVPGDTNGRTDVFVRDLQNHTTERVSIATTGTQGDAQSFYPSISADGRFVVYYSSSTNLAPGDTNGTDDIFVRDRSSATTEFVSLATDGSQGNFASDYPSLSDDGRYVAFRSDATNLVAGDTNGTGDIFVRDCQSSTTERVSLAMGGQQSNSISTFPSISADGRYVAFESFANNLVPGDTNGFDDVFVRDRHSATTERVSVTTSLVQGNGGSGPLLRSVSADGRVIAFFSNATNLVSGDTNSAIDVFVRDRGPSYSSMPFCFGDGSGAPCPCVNTGPTGVGCLNSLGTGGQLRAIGNASLAMDTVVLSSGGMPNVSVLYFQGTAQSGGGGGVAFGDGLRCAGGVVTRLSTKNNVNGASQYPDVGDPSVSVRGVVAVPGIRTYQVWYRNAAAFCTPSTFNLTNGVQVIWTM